MRVHRRRPGRETDRASASLVALLLRRGCCVAGANGRRQQRPAQQDRGERPPGQRSTSCTSAASRSTRASRRSRRASPKRRTSPLLERDRSSPAARCTCSGRPAWRCTTAILMAVSSSTATGWSPRGPRETSARASTSAPPRGACRSTSSTAMRPSSGRVFDIQLRDAQRAGRDPRGHHGRRSAKQIREALHAPGPVGRRVDRRC